MSTNDIGRAQTLLHTFPALQHRCDLDLLVFFAKHPCTLLTTQHIGQLLGYQLNEIAQSRNVLLAAGLLSRTQHQTRQPRLYVFAAGGADGGSSLSALVRLALMREGLLALRRALVPASPDAMDRQATRAGTDMFHNGPLPAVVSAQFGDAQEVTDGYTAEEER